MSLRNFSTVGGFLLVAGLVAACVSTEETNAGPQFKYPSEASFCEALAKAECNTDVVKACYSVSDDTNKGACVAARSSLSACRTSVTGVDNANVVGYNPAAAESCIAKHTSIYADAELTVAELDAAKEACIKVYSGAGSAGSTCEFDSDCNTAKNLRCVTRPGASGTCAEPRVVAAGADCSDPAAQCADDQFCGEAVSGQICQNKLPEGSMKCSETVPCGDAAKCAIDMMTMVGTCEAKLADGADCTADDDCAGSFCEKDKDTDAGVCASVYTITRFTHSCDGFKN